MAKKKAKKTDKKEKTKKKKTKAKKDDNVVYVGRKPTMSYVLAVMTQFNDAGANEVSIKARGRSISRAVDVAEVVRNKFLSDLELKKIEIGTEERKVEDGNTINVSTMNIVLAK